MPIDLVEHGDNRDTPGSAVTGAQAEAVQGDKGALASITRNLVNAGLVLAVYLLLTVILRSLLPWSLLLDEAEQSFLSQFLLAGYGPQPPFYNWLQNIIVSAAGLSMWSLAATKFGVLFLCYVLYGLAAQELLGSRSLAAFAMLALLTLPQISYMPQQDLTHTVAVLMATSLFFYGVFRTLLRPSFLSYLLIGLASGIGVISKYNFAILPIAMFIALLFDRDWRNRLLNWRMLVAIATALLIVAPHAIWLLDNLGYASAETLDKMDLDHDLGLFAQTFKGVASLLRAMLAYCALTIVIFFAAFGRDCFAAVRAGDRFTRLIERVMLTSLLLVVLVIVVTGATHITERWLNPFLVVLPLYLLAKVKAASIDLSRGLRRLRPVFPVLMVITLIPLAARTTIVAPLTGKYTNINVPFAQLVDKLMAEGMPASVITDDIYLAGNIHMQLPSLPIRTSGPIGADTPMKDPVLAIWRPRDMTDKTIPAGLVAALPEIATSMPAVETVEAPYYFGKTGDRYRLNYVRVHVAD